MAPPRRSKIAIGPDVGKSLHQAYVMTRDVEMLTSKPVANRKMPSARFSPNSSAPSAYPPSIATHEAPSCSAATTKPTSATKAPLSARSPHHRAENDSKLAISININVSWTKTGWWRTANLRYTTSHPGCRYRRQQDPERETNG